VSVALSRFSDLRDELLDRDLHMHTDRTDGRNSLEDMVDAAAAARLREVAITDHVRRTSEWFADHTRAIRAIGERASLTVWVGIEAKALDEDGTIDATDEMIAGSDLVLGSVHRFPDGHGGLLDYGALTADEIVATELRLALGLIRGGRIHVLAHPGGMSQRRLGSFPAESHRLLMREAARRGVAIEMNASYAGDLRTFLQLCREEDPLVSVASDAHGVEEVGRCRDLLREMLRP
jgi:putative hydrolase